MFNMVSTNSLFATPRLAVADLQAKLNKAQYELTSGEVADPVETLGSKIGLDEALRSQSVSLNNMQSTNAIVAGALTASQDALTNISKDAQSFISALMTAQSTGDISALAAQARSYLDAFTSYANTSSGGAYLFGGTNNTATPLASYSGAPQAAVAAAFQAEFGFSQSSSQASTISAASLQTFLSGQYAGLFADPAWSVGWSQAASTQTSAVISPGRSVTTSVSTYQDAFRQLASAYTSIADLGIGNLNSAAQQALIKSALSQIGAGAQGIGAMQAQLGFSQSQITTANKALQTQASMIDSTVSELSGVDPYQAAQKLTNLTTQLETAYSLTRQISKLGLVNYL